MKKFILSLGLVSLLFTSMYSQEVDKTQTKRFKAGIELMNSRNLDYEYNKNEFYVTYGVPSILCGTISFFSIFKIFGAIFPENYFGPLTAGYNYYLDNYNSLGIMTTFEYIIDSLVPSVQIKYTKYFDPTPVDILVSYFSLSLGIAYFSKAHVPYLDFCNGVKTRFKHFNIFGEISFGTTGLVKLGVAYSF